MYIEMYPMKMVALPKELATFINTNIALMWVVVVCDIRVLVSTRYQGKYLNFDLIFDIN